VSSCDGYLAPKPIGGTERVSRYQSSSAAFSVIRPQGIGFRNPFVDLAQEPRYDSVYRNPVDSRNIFGGILFLGRLLPAREASLGKEAEWPS
jgi:hypothetical protein